MVTALIRKLWPLYVDASMPALSSASLTKNDLVSGTPDAWMKRGPGAGPRTARYCHSACTGRAMNLLLQDTPWFPA